MKAIQIVGFKKSGKTTLAVALAEALKARGVSLAAAKFMHHPRLDKDNADTQRLMDACQGPVAAFGPEETALFWNKKRYLPDLLPLLGADFLIIEGGKTLGYMPRVILPRDEADIEGLDDEAAPLALASYGPVPVPGLARIETVEELADLALAKGFILPGLNCEACGLRSCRQMAARIVAGDGSPDDCAAVGASMSITVNGQPLGVNPFVESIIAGGVRGMLSRLKGYAPGKVVIKIEK